MPIEQPTFPLTTAALVTALHTGHGRARQQIDGHGSSGLEDKVIKACVSCLTCDPQCEADRAPWLVSMVDRANLHAQVTQAIEATLQESPSGNHRDMAQRSAILKELAAAGSDDARRLLYASLVRLPHTSDVIGAEHIVALDGVDGLMHVARQLGRWLQVDPDFRVDDDLVVQFDESTGVEGGWAALEREAALDPDVARCVVGMRKTREGRSGASSGFDITACTAAEIVAHVNHAPKDPCHWFRRWGSHATSDQREVVFAALLASDKPEQVKRLFRCFARTGVPRFDRRLLQWLAHADKQVQWAAVKAVAPIRDIELRRLAMQWIAEGDIANGIALLVNNFEAGDFALCAKHVERVTDVDEVHHLAGELLDLCEAHPGADALDCLLYVYERSPCSTCRRRAVKALIDTNTAPAWVITECTFDADPDTRALASRGAGHCTG